MAGGPCALVDGRPDCVSPLSQGSNGPRKSLLMLKNGLVEPFKGMGERGWGCSPSGDDGRLEWARSMDPKPNPGPCAWDPRKQASQTSSKERKAWFFCFVCQSPGRGRVGISNVWNDEACDAERRLWLADHVTIDSKNPEPASEMMSSQRRETEG